MDHSETNPFSHLPNVYVVTDSVGLDEGGVESSFTFSVSPNKSQLSLESRCFVCWGCITKSDNVTNDPKFSLFQQLLSTFDLRPCVLNMLKADNSCIPNAEFCNYCSSYLMEAATLMRKVEEIKIHLTNLRKHLKSALVSSFLANPDDNENSVPGKVLLRKAFAQCWSDCVVQLTRIPNNKKRRGRPPKTTIRKVRKPAVDDVIETESEKISNPSASRNSQNDVEVGPVDERCESQHYLDLLPESPIVAESPSPAASPSLAESDYSSDSTDVYVPKGRKGKTGRKPGVLPGTLYPAKFISCRYCGLRFEPPKDQESVETLAKEFGNAKTVLDHLRFQKNEHVESCPKNPASLYQASASGKFVCQECGKEYVNRVSLVYHVGSVHEKIYKFVCEHCGQGYQNTASLNRHVYQAHSAEKKHACDVPNCGLKFKRAEQLRVHQRSHTGERPFMCEVCGKSFAGPIYLKRHVAIHEENTVFTCPVEGCGKTFPVDRYMKYHLVYTHGQRRKQNKRAQEDSLGRIQGDTSCNMGQFSSDIFVGEEPFSLAE